MIRYFNVKYINSIPINPKTEFLNGCSEKTKNMKLLVHLITFLWLLKQIFSINVLINKLAMLSKNLLDKAVNYEGASLIEV